jgi:O-antigen/teichoic acid export membrane protein
MSLIQRILENTGVQWLERIVNLLIKVAVTVLLTNYLGRAGFGRYSLILTMTAFFVALTDPGLDDITVKHLARATREAKNILGGLLIIKLVLAAIASFLALLTVLALRYDWEIISGMAVALLSIFFAALTSVGTAYFRANLQMRYAVAASISASLGLLVMVVVAVQLKASLIGIIMVTSLSGLIGLIVTAYFLFSLQRPAWSGFDTAFWKKIGLAALPLGLAYFLSNIYMSIDVAMLSRLATFSAVGLYSAAYKFIYFGIAFPLAFVNTLFPLMARYWRTDLSKLRQLFQVASDYLALAGAGVASVLWLVAPSLMLIFGRDFQAGAVALRILSPALGLMFLSILVSFLLVSVDKQKALLGVSLFAVTTNVLLNFWLIPKYSFIGAAWVTLITEVVVLAPACWLVYRTLACWPWRSWGKALLASLASLAVGVVVTPLGLPLQLVLACITFVVVVTVVKAVRLSEVRLLWGEESVKGVSGGADWL